MENKKNTIDELEKHRRFCLFNFSGELIYFGHHCNLTYFYQDEANRILLDFRGVVFYGKKKANRRKNLKKSKKSMKAELSKVFYIVKFTKLKKKREIYKNLF